MNRYPRLREETERIIANFVREKEQLCKNQVLMMIDCELAYMVSKCTTYSVIINYT